MSIGFGASNAGLHKHCIFNVDGVNPRSNKGEPTINLITTEFSSWSGTSGRTSDYTILGEKYKGGNVYRYEDADGVNPATYVDNYIMFSISGLTEGDYYTFSLDIRVIQPSTTPGTGSNNGAWIWYGDTAPYVRFDQLPVGVWERIEVTTTVGSTYDYLYARIDYDNSIIDIANPQFEKKSYSTPYVNGTRNKWYDVSGNGYDVTLYNDPTSGDSNGTFQFRSRDDSDMSYGVATFDEGVLRQGNEAGAWAIETLYKYVSAAPRSECVVAGRSGCHGGIYMYADGWLKHAIKTDSCWNGSLNENIVQQSVGEWYHTIQSYEHGVQRSYLNGELVDTATLDINARNMHNYATSFRIGGIKSGTTAYATNTDIAFVRCYNTHINEIEALKLYHSAKGRMK